MIDPKQLETASRLMRERGLYAQQDFCCSDDGCGEMNCWIDHSETDWGWAFYNPEENERMMEGEDLFILYGSFEDPDTVESEERLREGITRVGSVVQECLQLAGLECEWDGDWEHKIVVLSPAGMTEAASGAEACSAGIAFPLLRN